MVTINANMWTKESDWISSLDTLYRRIMIILWRSKLARLVECRIWRGSRRKGMDLELMEMDLEVIQMVAEGGYGRVFRCRDLDTGDVVALKQISIVGMNQGVPAPIIREVSLLKDLHHINIISLLKVGYTDHRFVNLVFEHLDCDLHKYIQDRRYPKDAKIRKYFMFQILSAVAYCHSRNILHRDLKPRNLLIDHSKRLIKLADFGLAREIGDSDVLHTMKIGTCWYRAPEILCDTYIYSTPVDLWSVGCIFAEMVIGQPLLEAVNCPDELEAIFRLLGTPTEETWPGVTILMPKLRTYPKYDSLNLGQLREIMCLFAIAQGLETFVTDLERVGLNLLSMLLCLDPNKRISAEAALKHPYFRDVDLVFEETPVKQWSRCVP
ncbi:Cell division control protein 2-like protein, partial [Mucuna pruriens]